MTTNKGDTLWGLCLYPARAHAPPDERCGKHLTQWADESWRCDEGHFNTGESLRREYLGRLVRAVWVVWAREQSDPKTNHLLPWESLSEKDREVDERIGETLAGVRDWRVGQSANPDQIAVSREERAMLKSQSLITNRKTNPYV
jgi:hypothetical protein